MRISAFFKVLSIAFLTCSAGSVYAMDAKNLEIDGYVGFEMGQIKKGRYQMNPVDHVFMGSTVGNFNLVATPSEKMQILLGMEGRMWFNTFPPTYLRDKNLGYDIYASFYLHQAQGIFTPINSDAFKLQFSVGVMPYKYNPEVHNLGEYLFRTGTYPAYIINYFDFPMARLAGVMGSASYDTDLFGAGLDLMILTEREIRPFHDISIAAVARIDFLKKFVTLGGGINMAHLWAVDSRMTTPELYDNMYIKNADSTGAGDTAYYTFTGTKLMGRATIDPLALIREDNKEVLGDGGKLYGEVAIIGLENHPANSTGNLYGYDKLNEKMPLMFGLSLPAWKILDVFALEFEYFACPYPNSYDWVYRQGLPIPSIRAAYDLGDSAVYDNDNWKWSLHLRKDFTPQFGAAFQIGRDHTRWEVHVSHSSNYDFEDALVKTDEIAWRGKIFFRF